MPLSIFGFRALWSPYYAIALLLIIVLYILVTGKWRHKFEDSRPLENKERNFFLLGMVLLYILKGSPIDLMGHLLFTVHMTQMAFLLLLTVPLLVMGIPKWIWAHLFKYKAIDKLFRLFTNPLVAVFAFGLLFSAYHYPIIFDTVKLNIYLHAIMTTMLFMSAVFFWWPVVNNVEGQPQLHGLKKIGYVVLSAILITPACTLIIFGETPIYATYTDGEAWLQAMALCVPATLLTGLSGLGVSGPEVFYSITALYDQQLGGILMKVAQEVIYVVVIGKIFFKWASEERLNADEITAKELLKHQQIQANEIR